MLCLYAKVDEKIYIGESVIVVSRIIGKGVRLAIDADPSVPVDRECVRLSKLRALRNTGAEMRQLYDAIEDEAENSHSPNHQRAV
jgi:hypothetical protein